MTTGLGLGGKRLLGMQTGRFTCKGRGKDKQLCVYVLECVSQGHAHSSMHTHTHALLA